MHNYMRLIIALLIFSLGVAARLDAPAFVDRLAFSLEDFKFSTRAMLGYEPESPDNIVIVAVDEKSINRIGRWPWSHTTFARMIENLSAARLVGLDMVFADPTDPASDLALADAIYENDNVIAGFFFRGKATELTSLADLDQLAEWAYRDVKALDAVVGIKEYPFVETNLVEIGESALAGGAFNGEPDIDGLYRNYPIANIHKGYIVPSLAIQMFRFHRDREPGLVLDADGIVDFTLDDVHISEQQLRLNYGRLADAQFISASDVIDGSVPPDFFQDKLVLVGVTEVGLFDLRPTPFNPVTPVVWIHYTALVNLIDNSFLTSPAWVDILLLLGGFVMVWLVGRQKRVAPRVAAYIALLVGLWAMGNFLLVYANLWVREFSILWPNALFLLFLEVHTFLHTEKRAGELRRAFSAYVSPDVVKEIIDNPESCELGGQERVISVLFSDIRGFTSLSEQVSATQLVQMLNRVHGPMTQVVLDQRGMLDKYIGDAMMALFNTPVELEDHAERSVRAALEMLEVLARVNREFADEGLPQIDMGVGVNTGECIVGNVGSEVRFDYTAIGDAVNLASRLEGLCKQYGVKIIVSEFTRESLGEALLVRPLDRVRVKGKQEPVTIYHVLVRNALNEKLCADFEKALECYFAGDFEKAAPLFGALADETNDVAATLFAARCQDYLAVPPGDDWDGVWTMTSK